MKRRNCDLTETEEMEQLLESQRPMDEASAVQTADWFEWCTFDRTLAHADDGMREIWSLSAEMLARQTRHGHGHGHGWACRQGTLSMYGAIGIPI
jgi:hypothetical protein